MAAITICSDFGAQNNKVWHCFHYFPIYFPCSDGARCHDLRFLIVELKSTFSLSSFTFIKRLLSSSSLSALRVVSSAYLRLFIFLPAKNCSLGNNSFLLWLIGTMLFSAIRLSLGRYLPTCDSTLVIPLSLLHSKWLACWFVFQLWC